MELTRRVTVEEENESRGQLTTETVQELSTQDEFTDRVSTVLQDTHSTSVSASVSGTIAIVSGEIGITDSYTSTQTTSKEQMRRTLKQSTQRVSQQLMKSYVIRSRRVEDVTTRDTFRRLLKNDSDGPMHFGFRKTLQQYLASTQYLGPQLVWHVAVPFPGVTLKGARVVSPRLLPGPFMQQTTRVLLLTNVRGFTRNYDRAGATVYDLTLGVSAERRFVGARFLNGRDTVEVTATGANYSVNFVVKLILIKINPNGSVTLRFRPFETDAEGSVPNIIPITIPEFQLVTIDESVRVAADNKGEVTLESFLEDYREFLMEVTSVNLRHSGDLRQEEKSLLLSRALGQLKFAQYYAWDRLEDIKKFDEIFDTKSSFYNLYPPHYNSTGALDNFGGSGVITEYDTFRDLQPARYGASLGWKIQLDADARRTEFINSPLARVCIPVVRGREADAIEFLLANLQYRLATNVTEVLNALSARRTRENHLNSLGKSEESVDPRLVSERVDEGTAPDDRLAVALYPITDVFAVTDPLTGFIYEPLEL